MPINIIDADIFTVTVQAPADGDAVNSAIAALGHQDIADRTNFLHRRQFGVAGLRRHPVPLNMPAVQTGASWLFDDTNFRWEDTINNSETAVWACDTPVSGLIVAVQITSQGVGHGGAWPATSTSPIIELIRSDQGVDTIISTLEDPSAIGVIDTIHTWGPVGLAEDIGSAGTNRSYWVRFTGEGIAAEDQPDHRLFSIALIIDPAA